MAFFGILTSLFPLFVIAGIVMLVRRSRSGSSGSDDASVSLRRLLEYCFLAVALGLAASGLDSLFSAAVEALVEGTDDVDTPSWAITSLLVGGIALWFLVRNVRRRFEESPDEQGALGWVLYQGILELVTLIGFAIAVNDLLDGIIGAGDVEPQNLVHLAVWGAVWVVHIRLGDRIVGGEPVRSTLVPFAVSINALGALVASVGVLIALCSMAVYEGITGYSSWGGTVDGIRDVASVLIVSAALWWWYWLRQAVHDRGSMLHHAYTLFVGVLGGLGALVGVSVMFLAALINWGFAIGEDPAVEYFDFLPVAVAVAVVATLVWRYHRELVPPVEGRPRNDVDRSADHLAAFVGICALLAGVFVVLFVAFHHLTPVPPGAERETTMVIIVGLPLLVVGALVWRRFWPYRSVPAMRRRSALRSVGPTCTSSSACRGWWRSSRCCSSCSRSSTESSTRRSTARASGTCTLRSPSRSPPGWPPPTTARSCEPTRRCSPASCPSQCRRPRRRLRRSDGDPVGSSWSPPIPPRWPPPSRWSPAPRSR